jgi:glycerophosphoryl diester phosphodiesterase
MSQALVIAHRGASAHFPEHSRAALLGALDQGAHGVEMDLRLCADGRLLLHHDATLKRCCGDSRPVSAIASGERVRLNACHRRPDLPPEAPLLLEEVLELLPSALTLFLELKEGPEQLPALKRALGKRREALVLISFNGQTLEAAGALLPGLPRLWLRGGTRERTRATRRRWLAWCQRKGLQGLDVEAPLARGTLAQECELAGLHLGAWTVDEPEVARSLQSKGVRWICTNRPAEILAAL